ncbi:MAG: phospholipase D-like domain-containing protein, partial [DPANN group archaeon]|nr:phospholipase D-like domain-containing protein [DPANN group archaeon]
VDVGEKDKFAGLEYITQGGDGLMHNKFCIFDNQTVFTGSFNPTQKQNTVDNNNIIIINSKYLAENYEDEFNELYNRQVSGPPTKYPQIIYNGELIENYFCPEDHCANHVIEALNSSTSEIKFMTFSFTYDAIGDLLLAKNVSVQGIFDKQQASSNYSQFHKLNGTLDVRLDGGKGLLHHKVFIIDRKIVVTGSFNPTKSADTINDENLLIIHSPEIAEKYLTEFNELWNASNQ